MYLINAKLGGKDVPTSLPMSLIPPSLRGSIGKPEVSSGPSNAAKDLFDLFDDATPAPPAASPPPSQPTSAILPQASYRRGTRSPPHIPSPNRQDNDLLWDEPAPSTVNENSAELGNRQNELANTSRSLDATVKTRQDLERTASDQQTELSELELKLSSAKEKHEQELKAVADLRLRVGEQSTKLKQVQSEVISAESDVSAMRSEKDELGQALLRDKEEIRSLQRMMKEIDEEKASMKSVLEKMRKEARQQKGMVTIAKKQLSTAETSRNAVQKEIDEEAVTAVSAAAIPLPATPQALSPMATGVSQRSNNPFDRLNRGGNTPVSSVAMIGASAAGAATAIVAGAESILHVAKDTLLPSDAESDSATKEEIATEHAASKEPASATETDQLVTETEKPSAVSDLTAVAPPEETDPFVMGEDPFGAPSAAPDVRPQDTVDFGFGDAFDEAPESNAAQVASHPSASADFDAAFAALDGSDPIESRAYSPVAPAVRLSTDMTANNVQAALVIEPNEGSEIKTIPIARSAESNSGPIDDVEEVVSSDEEEGPEDVETPSRYQSVPPILSAPIDTIPARRSAPPPPTTSRATAADSDPFGAPSATPPADTTILKTLSPDVSVPKNSTFDDDDFDFSDLPPAKVENVVPVASSSNANFDDEFAGFDDEFTISQPPSGSDGSTAMSKSYELVTAEPRVVDEWGVPSQQNQQPSSLSFDDAFGGDFESVLCTKLANYRPQSTTTNNVYAPAGKLASGSPSNLAPPPLPQRQDSQPQGDDIEDVKKASREFDIN